MRVNEGRAACIRILFLWSLCQSLPCHLAAGALPATYPADPLSRPSSDIWPVFETLCGVSVGGGSIPDLAKTFTVNTLTLSEKDGAPCALWSVQAKNRTPAYLDFYQFVLSPVQSFSLKVIGLPPPLKLSLALREVPWNPDTEKDVVQWVIQGDSHEEKDVYIFRVADAVPDRPVERRSPAWPVALGIKLDPVGPSQEIALLLSQWTLKVPSPSGLKLLSLDADAAASAGSPWEVEIKAEGDVGSRDVALELWDGRYVFWRTRLTEEEKSKLSSDGSCTLQRTLPWALPGRELSLGLVVDGLRIEEPGSKLLISPSPSTGWPSVKRTVVKGRPRLLVNDKPFTWSGYASYDFQPGNVGEFGASGAQVFVIPTNLGCHVHQIGTPTWVRADAFDFRELEERVLTALQANPDAWLMLRVSLGLPPFWTQAHPDAMTRIRTDQGDLLWRETGTSACSMSSEDWLAQVQSNLSQILQFCASQPWASRVFAVLPTYGVTEEWFSWGCNNGFYADYCPAEREGFRLWCEKQNLPFTQVPDPKDRQRPGFDLYPADESGKACAAYARYSSERTALIIAQVAEAVKKETQDRLAVGAFYGYVIQLAGEPRQHTGANFAMRDLLDHPALDFFLGVPLHNGRHLTRGYDTTVTARESILESGKLYVDENDLFSWLHPGVWHTFYNDQDPLAGAISMHRRNLADDLIHGAPRQWFSLSASWHHDPGLQAEFKKEIQWLCQSMDMDLSPTEEVAFVVDDTTFSWVPADSALGRFTHQELLCALGRTGAPVGVWLLSDMDKLPPRIRFVVVAGAEAAMPQDIDKLKKALAQPGRTFVIVGAVGLVDPVKQTWDGSAPGQITGLPVMVDYISETGKLQLFGDGPKFEDIPDLCPRAQVREKGFLSYADGVTAGTFRNLSGGGKLIWVGVAPPDNRLFRRWLEEAKVHLYAPMDFSVHASRDVVSVTAPLTEKDLVPVTFPEPVSAEDLYDGWTGQGQTLNCPFSAGQTRLFRLKHQEP